jgi:hypothetical protein
VITLNRVTTKNQRTFEFPATGIGIIVATAVLLAFITVPELIPSQVSAQITPTLNPDTSNAGIGSMAEDLADPVQNGTSANITQLATIPTAAPITPSTFTPLSEETGDSGDSSSNDDDDDSDSGSDNESDESDSGSDNESDDSDDDNDDGDGDSSAIAIAGGGRAVTFAG